MNAATFMSRMTAQSAPAATVPPSRDILLSDALLFIEDMKERMECPTVAIPVSFDISRAENLIEWIKKTQEAAR